MPRPSLAAALITRDAGIDLRRCLASLHEHVDEIVLVDTGSTDDTLDIAHELGAKVGHFEWIDDFAAARNAALEMVQTDWVLSIDADEELILKAGPETLAQAFAIAPAAVLMIVPIRDARHGGITYGGRIFKRVPGTHWELPIHETIVQPGFESIPPVDVSQGLELVHHGYTDDNSGRIERNLRILRNHLNRDPDSPSSLFYLARECAFANLCQEGYEAGVRLLEEFDFEGPRLADIVAITAWNAIALERLDEVIELTKDARRWNVATVWTEYVRALAYMVQGNKPRALEAAERACSLPYPEGSLLNFQEIWTTKRFELRSAITQAMQA